MTGFDLPTNYVDDPEALLKRTKAKLKKVSALESKDNPSVFHKPLLEISTSMTKILMKNPKLS